MAIGTHSFSGLLPHENTPQNMPISLGTFLITRANLSVIKRSEFIRFCDKLGANHKLLESEIATQVVEYLKISMLQNYTNLIELVYQWRNNG